MKVKVTRNYDSKGAPVYQGFIKSTLSWNPVANDKGTNAFSTEQEAIERLKLEAKVRFARTSLSKFYNIKVTEETPSRDIKVIVEEDIDY